MDIPNIKSNSFTDREGAEEPTKVVRHVADSSNIVRKPKGLFKRFIESYLGIESVPAIKGNLKEDVLKPRSKELIYDLLTEGLSLLLWSDGSKRPSSRRNGSSGNASWHPGRSGNVGVSKSTPSKTPVRRSEGVWHFDDILFPSKVVADDVRDSMLDIFEQGFDMATVANYYEIIEEHTGDVHDISSVDHDWGWTYEQILGVKARCSHGMWYLELPKIVHR